MPAHPLFMRLRRLFDRTEPDPGHSRVWHTSCRCDQIKEAVFRRNPGAKQPPGTILKVYLPHFGRCGDPSRGLGCGLSFSVSDRDLSLFFGFASGWGGADLIEARSAIKRPMSARDRSGSVHADKAVT